MTKPTKHDRREIVAFISAFIDDNGYSPSFRDIADHFQMSTCVVSYALNQLRDWGVISYRDRTARTIRIVGKV